MFVKSSSPLCAVSAITKKTDWFAQIFALREPQVQLLTKAPTFELQFQVYFKTELGWKGSSLWFILEQETVKVRQLNWSLNSEFLIWISFSDFLECGWRKRLPNCRPRSISFSPKLPVVWTHILTSNTVSFSALQVSSIK